MCLLVMLGVRADGTTLVALADGFRESSDSWADLLRGCKRRGMRAPVLAVGDGALGFWKAVRDVFPETRAALLVASHGEHPGRAAERPSSRRPRSPRSTTPRTHALVVKAFEIDFGAKFPKAVAKVTDEIDTLLSFYDYPAELDPPAHADVDLCDCQIADSRHEGPRLASRRRRDGLA